MHTLFFISVEHEKLRKIDLALAVDYIKNQLCRDQVISGFATPHILVQTGRRRTKLSRHASPIKGFAKDVDGDTPNHRICN